MYKHTHTHTHTHTHIQKKNWCLCQSLCVWYVWCGSAAMWCIFCVWEGEGRGENRVSASTCEHVHDVLIVVVRSCHEPILMELPLVGWIKCNSLELNCYCMCMDGSRSACMCEQYQTFSLQHSLWLDFVKQWNTETVKRCCTELRPFSRKIAPQRRPRTNTDLCPVNHLPASIRRGSLNLQVGVWFSQEILTHSKYTPMTNQYYVSGKKQSQVVWGGWGGGSVLHSKQLV